MRPPSKGKRIANALTIVADGMFDGDHHKTWYIDQMVRALLGCPIEFHEAIDCRGESEEYLAWVAAYEDGENGPETYSWDEGIAP
jgi:hypothetical protein